MGHFIELHQPSDRLPVPECFPRHPKSSKLNISSLIKPPFSPSSCKRRASVTWISILPLWLPPPWRRSVYSVPRCFGTRSPPGTHAGCCVFDSRVVFSGTSQRENVDPLALAVTRGLSAENGIRENKKQTTNRRSKSCFCCFACVSASRGAPAQRLLLISAVSTQASNITLT